jgi:RNA recognition motif-containing protein
MLPPADASSRASVPHARPELGRRGRLVSTKLYVGNLSFDTNSDDLLTLFGQHGTVTSAQVVTDRETGRSRGFAFVEMSSGAEAAIQALHMREFQGRNLTVNEAKPRDDRPRSGGGGGGSGGGRGYGGGRRY